MPIYEELYNQYKKNLEYLIRIKGIIGNLDNEIHTSAMQLIKIYLKEQHPEIQDWEFKEGGQAGIDIEGKKDNKLMVIGELKTTNPYLENDFGAAQKKNIIKDLERLENAYLPYKYFFIVNKESFSILHERYRKIFPSVKIINIMDPEMEYSKNETVNTTYVKNKQNNISKPSVEWDVEVKLTQGPITGGFFNISTKYQHLIEEGDINIINDEGAVMHCHTVQSMGTSRIARNLNIWFKKKRFQPGDKFFLKKIGQQKFEVVSINKINRIND